MPMIERLLLPAASAISEEVSDLLLIISRIITSWEGARQGAIVAFAALSIEDDEVARGTRQRRWANSARADS